MFTDKNFGSSSAPVDKRGRRKESALQRYYELKEEEEERVKAYGGSKVDVKEEEVGVPDSDESDEMEELSDVEIDTDDDDEMLIGGNESESEEQEEEVPEIEQETSRLAAVNLDWHHIKAVDLYVLLNSFLPDGGKIRSVTVYPSEFGMERMKEEAVHGPIGLFVDDGEKIAKKRKHEEDGSDSDSGNQNGNEEDCEDEDVSGNESEDGREDTADNPDENEEEYEEEEEK